MPAWVEDRPLPILFTTTREGLIEATEPTATSGYIMRFALHRIGNPTRPSPLSPPGRGLG